MLRLSWALASMWKEPGTQSLPQKEQLLLDLQDSSGSPAPGGLSLGRGDIKTGSRGLSSGVMGQRDHSRKKLDVRITVVKERRL